MSLSMQWLSSSNIFVPLIFIFIQTYCLLKKQNWMTVSGCSQNKFLGLANVGLAECACARQPSAPEGNIDILKNIKSLWCLLSDFHFTNIEMQCLCSTIYGRKRKKSWRICIVSLYVLAWKIPFGSADDFYMASSFFPAAVFQISLE